MRIKRLIKIVKTMGPCGSGLRRLEELPAGATLRRLWERGPAPMQTDALWLVETLACNGYLRVRGFERGCHIESACMVCNPSLTWAKFRRRFPYERVRKALLKQEAASAA